ncbi:MAG: hypothetical protein JWR21_1188 [Herminiimonas sp.]|nr:hypothetical protein [Herminiimonas sp.]
MLGHTRSNTSPGSPMRAPSGGEKATAHDGGGAATHRTPPATKVGTPTSGALPGESDSKTAAPGASPVRIRTREKTPKAREKDGKSSTNWQPANTIRPDGDPGSPRNNDNVRRGPRVLAPARYKIEKPLTLATLANPSGSSTVVMVKGSWFSVILSYNAEKVIMTSPARMPAFVSAMPAVLTGDGANWIEVLMCVERSARLADGSGDYLMPSTAGKPIFRGNPKISWNGKEVLLYAALAAFIKEKLSQTQLANLISSECEAIASAYPGMGYKFLEKSVTNETTRSTVTKPDMDLLGKYIDAISNRALETMESVPPEVLQVLTVLDHQIIKWALESGYGINEINAQRKNAIVQFFVTRGISALFTVPEGSIGAASVLRKYANKELNKLAPKLTAPILKVSSSVLPSKTKAKLEELLRPVREQKITADAAKKAKVQKALAEKRGLTRAATERGSSSSASESNARALMEAKRKLLKAVREDAAFESLSKAAKNLLETEFGELKQKGLNAEKIEMATRKLVERIRPTSVRKLAELEQYLAILQKRLLIDALYGEATFMALPVALQSSLKTRLDALAPAGMTADVVAAAANDVIEETSTTDDESSSVELFLPMLETGKWRPDYAAKEVENLLSDTWDLFSLDADMDIGPQPSQPPHEANAEVEDAQQGDEFEFPYNPFASELTSGDFSSNVDGVSSATPPVLTSDDFSSNDYGDPSATSPVEREREKKDRRNS